MVKRRKMKTFIFSLVPAFLIALLICQKIVLSEDSGDHIDYEKSGMHKVKILKFPKLKDSDRNKRRVPLKVLFPGEKGSYPLVIISHGGGGNWDANIYQAHHLASHGYVVICTEHITSNNDRIAYYMSRAGGRMSLWDALHRITKDPEAVLERPKDVSFAIDQAVLWNKDHKSLRERIYAEKAAVMGHSYGAYTTLVVCGAQPILDYLEPSVAPGKGLAGDLSDPRITFGFAMSPQSPGGTFFNRDSYKTINRPLVCLSGSRDIQKSYDGRTMLSLTRLQVFKLLPQGDKYFFWLKNADHLCFSDYPKAHLFPSKARMDAQRISKALMVLFCDHFLKGKRNALKELNDDYLKSLCGSVITHINWYKK